jgi:hypothetical protein
MKPLTALDWREVFLAGALVASRAAERREDAYALPRALEAMAAEVREIAERQERDRGDGGP